MPPVFLSLSSSKESLAEDPFSLEKSEVYSFTDSLEIRQVAGKGRGVFAKRKFQKGEVIERAPVLLLSQEEEPKDPFEVLFHYVFGWGPQLQSPALALGYGSFYNHCYSPNARYIRNEKELCIYFVAHRLIELGEEILVNYNGDPACQDPVWFDVKE